MDSIAIEKKGLILCHSCCCSEPDIHDETCYPDQHGMRTLNATSCQRQPLKSATKASSTFFQNYRPPASTLLVLTKPSHQTRPSRPTVSRPVSEEAQRSSGTYASTPPENPSCPLEKKYDNSHPPRAPLPPRLHHRRTRSTASKASPSAPRTTCPQAQPSPSPCRTTRTLPPPSAAGSRAKRLIPRPQSV